MSFLRREEKENGNTIFSNSPWQEFVSYFSVDLKYIRVLCKNIVFKSNT